MFFERCAMRINLCVYPAQKIEGYVNIHPYLDGFVNIPYDHLDQICSDGEADEIVLNSVLNFIEVDQHHDFVGLVSRKLKHNGMISASGLDSLTLCRAHTFSILGSKELSKAIEDKKSLFDIKYINSLFYNSGLITEQKKLINLDFVIIARRP